MEKKRFTVSLEADQYERLKEMAAEHRPPLTLQYMVRFAVELLIERAEDRQFRLNLGNPLRRRE